MEIKLRDLLHLKEKVSRDPRIQTLFPPTEIEALRWSINNPLPPKNSKAALFRNRDISRLHNLIISDQYISRKNFFDSLPDDHNSHKLNIDETQILVNPEVNDNF